MVYKISHVDSRDQGRYQCEFESNSTNGTIYERMEILVNVISKYMSSLLQTIYSKRPLFYDFVITFNILNV